MPQGNDSPSEGLLSPRFVFPPLLCRREGGLHRKVRGAGLLLPPCGGALDFPARGWQAWAPGGFGR